MYVMPNQNIRVSLNFYCPEFGCEDFLRIIDRMPYIVELDFDGGKLLSIKEHCHIEKEWGMIV